MILLDASAAFAFLSRSQHAHQSVRHVIDVERGPLILSPVVLNEIDYLVKTRLGVDAELTFLEDVATGAYELAELRTEDVEAATSLIAKYRDLKIGLADASIVVLAGRYETNRVLTLDERHFRVIRTPRGEPFTILPADA